MSNKKPSELAPWNEDKSMVVHAHKPGVSQKISIQDIVDAVPVPEMPELPEPLDVSEKGRELVALETVAAMKQMLEVSDIEASEAGKELVALETVAAMKEMLEVPGAGDGESLVGQESKVDTTVGRALLFGAFGLGDRTLPRLSLLGLNADTASIPTGFYELTNDELPNSLRPEIYNSNPNNNSNRYILLHIQTGANAMQFLFGKSRHMIFARTRTGTSNSTVYLSPWKNITETPAPTWDEVGTVLLGRVLDPSRGTLDAYEFYSDLTGRTGLQPTAFDGSDKVLDQPRISGTWQQISYCIHESTDPIARMALWRRVK